MSSPAPESFLAPIEALCREAGEIHMRHFRRLETYERKGAIDLVTRADREAEEAIASRIAREFPAHRLLGEEGSDRGPADSEWLWVVDPIDGTTNYAHGFPYFAVSIALLRGDDLYAGGVYAPALGELYLAACGAGATRNGEPLRVSTVDRLQDALVCTGFPYEFGPRYPWLRDAHGRFLLRTHGVLRLGAAALDMANVAAGTLEGFYELYLHPWDMAAGALLVTEAGGRITAINGGEFSIWRQRMACSNGLVHDQMLAVFAEGGPEPD